MTYRFAIIRWPNFAAAIGYVPQETFLFSNSLAKNIAFGVDEAERDQIARAAEIAGLDSDVSDFPEGFDTMVGERGITLSGRAEATHRDRARSSARTEDPDSR